MCELQMFDATSKAEAEFVDARVNAATLAEHDEFDLARDVMHSVPAIEEKDNLRHIIKVDSHTLSFIELKMLSFHHIQKACNLMYGRHEFLMRPQGRLLIDICDATVFTWPYCKAYQPHYNATIQSVAITCFLQP